MKSLLRWLMTGLLAGVLLSCVFAYIAACVPMRILTRWTRRAIHSRGGLSTLAGAALKPRSLRCKNIA